MNKTFFETDETGLSMSIQFIAVEGNEDSAMLVIKAKEGEISGLSFSTLIRNKLKSYERSYRGLAIDFTIGEVDQNNTLNLNGNLSNILNELNDLVTFERVLPFTLKAWAN